MLDEIGDLQFEVSDGRNEHKNFCVLIKKWNGSEIYEIIWMFLGNDLQWPSQVTQDFWKVKYTN